MEFFGKIRNSKIGGSIDPPKLLAIEHRHYRKLVNPNSPMEERHMDSQDPLLELARLHARVW